MSEHNHTVRILTWHIHGSYLYYLSQANFEIYLPVKSDKSPGYIGRGTTFPFGKNVHEVPVDHVKELEIDCVLLQTPKNYLLDQFEILSEEQQKLPKIYLEHDPPQEHPTNTRHVVNDPAITLVHVTDFNSMMWDNNVTPTRVVDHGIMPASVTYSGELEKGIVIINDLSERGRRLGVDIFLEARKHVPLDLIGMNTEDIGGLGEILHPQLPEFTSRYRFFFNPIRYTSLGLAVLEAMMIGIPVVGMATTELVTVINNGVSGFIDTNLSRLIDQMKLLINDRELATSVGTRGRQVVEERFNIRRFTRDWERLFGEVISRKSIRSTSHHILEQQL